MLGVPWLSTAAPDRGVRWVVCGGRWGGGGEGGRGRGKGGLGGWGAGRLGGIWGFDLI